jgi:tetratricopeptide (TPR) repeat protein
VAGTVIAGRFELRALVAAGGMGTVHQAVDRQSGQSVALKLMGEVGGVEAGERFKREARLLAELDHPTVVRFVDAGVEPDGRLYLAMEWLEGEDLAKRLRRGPLGVAAAVGVARRIAEGLSAAHARGIVHRDVKPHNVFLVDGRLDRLKLVDFGIAFVAGAQSGITRTGMTIGTPEYMAPEQARGDRTLDARCDVYSLGCVLYQAIVGTPPFVGPTPVSVVAELLLSEAPRVGSRAPGVPPELDQLVAAMLSKDPAARPADGRAIAERLLALEHATPLSREVTSATLSQEERRLVTVVAVTDAPAVDPSGDDATVPIGTTSSVMPALAVLAERLGAELKTLPGGGLLVFADGAVATDLATRGARAAHELAAGGQRRVGVATGPASQREALPAELVRRAVGLASVAGEAHTDAATSALIASHFSVDRAKTGLRIAGERGGGDDAPPPSSRGVFVGRDREMAALVGAFDACVNDGVAQSVLVVGMAGLGKTRLLRALHDRLRGEPRAVALLDARADAYRQRAPLSVLGLLLLRGLGVPEALPFEERAEHLKHAVQDLIEGGDSRRVGAFVALAAGLIGDDHEPEVQAALQDPQLLEDQVGRALEDVLDALSRRDGAVVVMVDDGQWADAATLRLLSRAQRRLRERPVFVVVFARPEIDEVAPHLFRDAAAERIQLAGLPKRACERMVVASLGEGAPAETVQRIVAHAEGNPLFLEELVHAVREGRADDVPPTVLATLEARLARLEPSARKVLRAASIFGEAFWQGGVAELLGPDAPETASLGHWLVTLVDRDLLVPRRATRFAGQAEVAFRHALLRDVAYAMLTDDDRRRGHRLAASWLERAGEREPAVIAEHLEAAGQPALAAARWVDAAAFAFSRNDLVRATALVERALKQELEADVRGAALALSCQAHYWAGDITQAVARGLEAVRLFTPGTQGWLDATSALGKAQARSDDPGVLETVRRLCDTVAGQPSLVPSGHALAELTAGTLRRGQRGLALAVTQVLGGALLRARPNDPHASAQVLTCRSWLSFFEGDLAACVALDTEALRALEAGGDHRQIAVARVHVGYDLMMLGAYERAAEELGRAHELAGASGIDAAEWLAAHNLAFSLHRIGDVERGFAIQRKCLTEAVERQNRFSEQHARNYLARMLADSGRWAEAETEAERALAISDSSSMRWTVLALLASAALAQDQLALARVRIDEAKRGASTHRNVEEGEGLIRWMLIEVAMRSGEHERAQAELADARAWLLASAAKIGDEELRRSFLERIPEHAKILAYPR